MPKDTSSPTSTPPPLIQGWCPGAWQPMASGDGLVVRVRPRLGRLSAKQALLLADLAERFGTGLLELTSRANVQLRGVSPSQHPTVLQALADSGLLDADARQERLRNLIVDPLWHADDQVWKLAHALQEALVRTENLDALPAKFGFSISSGRHAGLAQVAADVRLVRTEASTWLIHPEGHDRALAAPHRAHATASALALARWCATQALARRERGEHPGRLSTLLRGWHAAHREWPALAVPAGVRWVPMPGAGEIPAPGWVPGLGLLIGAPLGRVSAPALARLAHEQPNALRVTPWRMLLAESITPQAAESAGLWDARHWISSPADARLRVSACTGAPGCSQALGPTQSLALHLAGQVPPHAHLHVSGCAKGCARQQAATITLRAQGQGSGTSPIFEVISNGSARGVAEAAWDERALRDNPGLLFEEN